MKALFYAVSHLFFGQNYFTLRTFTSYSPYFLLEKNQHAMLEYILVNMFQILFSLFFFSGIYVIRFIESITLRQGIQSCFWGGGRVLIA